MPDLLEPADARGGDRAVIGAPPAVPPEGSAATSVAGGRTARAVAARPEESAAPPVLFFDRVSKWYGPVIGVNQVTLELRPGITGLVGHNASGKSSLMRLAAGQTKPDLGRVLVGEHDAWSAEAKLHVGYCPELDTFYEEMSGRRFVETMGRLCGFSRQAARQRTGAILDLVGMSERADRPLASYSKGMRQRIKLAQALLHDPELLLLDEPLSGIDPIGRRESIALFKELAGRGKCLLISSHELDELEKLTDHVAIMAAGRIAAVGTLVTIRDLLDDHPLSIRLGCEEARHLAALLLGCEDVVGLDRVDGEETLIVRARNPRRFFRKLADLVIEENLEIRHLETLDESTRDVLGYLLGGKDARVTR
jgi:ABC-2 type transport system ATP-binding protein